MHLLPAALLFFSACADLPVREPTDVGHGLLVVRARVRGALLGFTSDEAEFATVEQLDPDGTPVPGKEASSGAFGEGCVYFTDMPPGRYAVTSVSFRARGARYRVDIPPAAGRKEAADLRPGAAAFLGEFHLSGRFPDFDVAVERALPVLGHWLLPWMKRPVISRDAELRGIERGSQAEADAMRAARRALGGTQWRRWVERRLRESGAPEPAKTTGTIRPRQLPLRSESFLSWRDTLGWGEPKRAGNGLVWSKPGGTARVVVFLTSATARGFSGFEAAVRQMRAAASSSDVSDRGELYEVRVATLSGTASRLTSHLYPEETLVGSQVEVVITETILVPSGAGMYTARLRASREEFDGVLPSFREFLLQLVLGPPAKPEVRDEDPVLFPL